MLLPRWRQFAAAHVFYGNGLYFPRPPKPTAEKWFCLWLLPSTFPPNTDSGHLNSWDSFFFCTLWSLAYLPTFLLLARERTIHCLFLKSCLASMTILWVWFLKTKQQIHAQVSRIFSFKFLRSLKESSLQSKRKGGIYPALYKARCVYRELKLIQQPVLSYIKLSN